eukprot:TRINITY_DN14194_c0_g1_i1.p1 TRINITY_DN14194_c0_g1~~TRINITY_DN14194_c0_g1_i1.p1  ORF type:complete len:293 (-),score=40.15 TRINITY_DN14194_c0_g1_i1:110-988(-)
MSGTGAGYDLSVTTFSPDGRVFQVEYANKAVEKSATVVGIRCKDGVVLGAEKSLASKMLVKTSDGGANRRIYTVDEHVGLAGSGLSSDVRQLVNKGREEAKDYKSFYGIPISGQVLAERVAGHVHTHTLYWYLRPFGCSVLVGSYSPREGPELSMIEPSGTSFRYFACAIGKYRQGAKTELEKIKFDTITCRDAVKQIAKIIYKLHDDIKDKAFELELSWVCDESKRQHVFVPKELREEAIKEAKSEKEKAEMDTDSDDDDEDGSKGKGKKKDKDKSKDKDKEKEKEKPTGK